MQFTGWRGFLQVLLKNEYKIVAIVKILWNGSYFYLFLWSKIFEKRLIGIDMKILL
jgi:hypothetical protein